MMALDPPAKMKLKRAPSYAASSSTGARPNTPASSDEEEKVRGVNAKRPRTRQRTQSNGSTGSGTTCVEKEETPSVTTSPEKQKGKIHDQDGEKEKTKLTAKKTKLAKAPEVPSNVITSMADAPSLEEPGSLAPTVKVKEQPSSLVTSPRLRPRARPAVALTPTTSANPATASSTTSLDNLSTISSNGQMAEVVAAAAAVGLTPADGTRSKSRSRSISPTHSVVPASPPRTLRRVTKTIFPKMQGKSLFGIEAGGDTHGIVFASAPAPGFLSGAGSENIAGERPCLGEAFVLTTFSAVEKVRKERER
jgi:hypothetical protein